MQSIFEIINIIYNYFITITTIIEITLQYIIKIQVFALSHSPSNR